MGTVLSSHQGTDNPAWTGKLYESDVIRIKIALAHGARKSELARDFSVSRQLISKIAHGQKWGWLKVDLDQIPCGPTGDDMFCACGCGGDDTRCNYWIRQYQLGEQVNDAHTCCRIRRDIRS